MSDMTARLNQVLERSAPAENDGMILCQSCKNRYVLIGDCVDCQRLDAQLNARYESRRTYFNQVERVDAGLAPFEPLDPQAFPAIWDLICVIAMVMLGLACFGVGAWHLGFGAWHLMKAFLGWLLVVSA